MDHLKMELRHWVLSDLSTGITFQTVYPTLIQKKMRKNG